MTQRIRFSPNYPSDVWVAGELLSEEEDDDDDDDDDEDTDMDAEEYEQREKEKLEREKEAVMNDKTMIAEVRLIE